ncbi:hypothetical protein JHK85_016278 [Glycine max]|nr:hypothetical protein JHK85_016278 [Glycine max]
MKAPNHLQNIAMAPALVFYAPIKTCLGQCIVFTVGCSPDKITIICATNLVPVELLEIERQLDARLRVFYHLEQLDNGVTPGWYICLKDFNALPKKDLVIGKYIDNNENPYSDNMFALDSESKPLDFPSSINDITQNLGPTMEGLRDTLDEAPKDQPCEAPKQRRNNMRIFHFNLMSTTSKLAIVIAIPEGGKTEKYNKENEIPELRVGTYTGGVEMKIKEKEEKEREE